MTLWGNPMDSMCQSITFHVSDVGVISPGLPAGWTEIQHGLDRGGIISGSPSAAGCVSDPKSAMAMSTAAEVISSGTISVSGRSVYAAG